MDLEGVYGENTAERSHGRHHWCGKDAGAVSFHAK
jgi:hypothetical protein